MVRIKMIELTFDGVNPQRIPVNKGMFNFFRYTLPVNADLTNSDLIVKNDLFEELYKRSVDLEQIYTYADCRLSGDVYLMTVTAGTYAIIVFEWLG